MTKYIGAHVSVAGGIEHAPSRAAKLGCNTAQIFSSSPRIWKKPPLTVHHLSDFFDQCQQHHLGSIFTHALYLINLASDKEATLHKSIKALKYELEFDAAIEGAGVVVHLGSHQGRGWDQVKTQLVASLKQVLQATPRSSTLLIENSAGQKGKIGSELTEIRWLLDQLDSPRLGWCFDTCHGFAAGYGLGQHQPADQAAKDRNQRRQTAIETISHLQLWSSLKCVHVNDSKGQFGSGIDRHHNLGQGQIPVADFKYFLNRPRVKLLPLILEVPGFAGHGPDAENVRILKGWLT